MEDNLKYLKTYLVDFDWSSC